MPQLGAHTIAQHQGQCTEQGGHGRHQDGPKAQQAGLHNRLARGQALLALGLQRKVNHHDGVLLHDANEQDDADHRDDAQVQPRHDQGQQRTQARRGQGGQNRHRVDVALIQHAQHDIHRDHCRQNQQQRIGKRGLKRQRRTLKTRFY